MMAVLKQSKNDSQDESSQGSSKQPKQRLDMVTGVKGSRNTRSQTNYIFTVRSYDEYSTDDETNESTRSNEERLLKAIETIP